MFLRQSTIQTIRFGPFLDAGDGVTEEVSLTITQALRRISKDGGDFAQSGETGNSTHDEDGWYFDNLTAADTNTVGELILAVQTPATHLPVWMRWFVLEEAVYDSIYGASAAGPLQATTAGRTLDIAATGEVALDFGSTIGTLDAAQFGADFITAAKVADNAFIAANFAAGSLNGKGDWNVGKTGYALTLADWNVGKTGYALTTQDWNVGKTGYSLATQDWNVGKTGYALTVAPPTAIQIRDVIMPVTNAILNNIPFLFVAASDHVTPVTGATGIVVTRSIDGAAHAAATSSVVEISNGIYHIDASAADLNGGIINFRIVATGGTPGAPDDAFVTVVTGAGV